MDGNGTDSSEDNRNSGILLNFYLSMVAAAVAEPLALMGLIGNNIFGKMDRQNAVTFLIRSLAVVYSCYLLIQVTFCYWYWSIIYGNGWIKTLASTLLPFMVVFVEPLFLLVNAWTFVVIGISRYIALCRPLHAARLCTTSHARKQIACVVLVSFAYSLPLFLAYKSIGADEYFGLKDLLDYKNPWYYYIYTVGCDGAVFSRSIQHSPLYMCHQETSNESPRIP